MPEKKEERKPTPSSESKVMPSTIEVVENIEEIRNLNPQKEKNPEINWFAKFDNQNTNYAPKQYPYWSSGAGPKRNVFRKNK